MKNIVSFILFFLLISVGLSANAETYKCAKGGQTVYSDTPCAAGATKVDAFSDKLSNDQRLQAEYVQQSNRRMLSEIEYQEARDREARNRAAYNKSLQERISNNRAVVVSR